MKRHRVCDLHNADPHDLTGQCVYMPEDVADGLAAKDAEIERLKRAVEWLHERADYAVTDMPADLAEIIIKPAAGESNRA